MANETSFSSGITLFIEGEGLSCSNFLKSNRDSLSRESFVKLLHERIFTFLEQTVNENPKGVAKSTACRLADLLHSTYTVLDGDSYIVECIIEAFYLPPRKVRVMFGDWTRTGELKDPFAIVFVVNTEEELRKAIVDYKDENGQALEHIIQ